MSSTLKRTLHDSGSCGLAGGADERLSEPTVAWANSGSGRAMSSKKESPGPLELRNDVLAQQVRPSKSGCYQSQTLGFPLLRREMKRVRFDPPRSARWMPIDAMWSKDCLVLSVWDNGALLRVRNPKNLTPKFFLLFTSSVPPVFRRCKRVRTRGSEVEVEYQQEPPSYLRHMQGDQ